MNYKCPYCLYPFSRDQVIVENRNDIAIQRCPNPAVVEEGSERRLCAKRLPLNFLESESIVIALTGGKYVGKTYYYLALLYQLKYNKALHSLGIQGDIVGSPDDQKKIKAFFDDVKRKDKLPATVEMGNALKSVIHLTITKSRRSRHVYLSFFDNPGERFNDIDFMIDNFANVYKADGLLFLFEPKQVEKLWKSILRHNEYLLDEEEGDDLYTVLNNTIQLVRHVNYVPASGSNVIANGWEGAKQAILKVRDLMQNKSLIQTPIALSVSKFDQLKKSIHVTIPFDETQLETMCIKNGTFNEELVNAISSEIDEVITGLPDGEARIKNLLDSNIKNYAYFGVKSIDVDEKGAPTTLNPQGVLLPLIWLLTKLGLY